MQNLPLNEIPTRFNPEEETDDGGEHLRYNIALY